MASTLLAVTVGAAFAFLVVSIYQLRESLRLDQQAERVLAVANKLERLFVDLETGQPGFLLTREEHFLEPWQDARAALSGETLVPVAATERPCASSVPSRVSVIANA
jgi:CHASE3 domain sensor protein